MENNISQFYQWQSGVEVACAPILCIPDDCIALQSQKYLPSSSAQMKTILKFIVIYFQNIFVPQHGCHPVLTARCLLFHLGLGELSFAFLPLCHKSL